MSKKIKIKLLSYTALAHFKKNLEYITKLIQNNDDNAWIKSEFTQPVFIEKEFEIDDFELKDNPDSKNKTIDFQNHIALYDSLKVLPRSILCDERFWLWLELDKFYYVTKRMMTIKSSTTIHDHWMFGRGHRRGLAFGVLSRCFFRIDLTIDENNKHDKYELSKWIIENPERFRNLTWRVFSSQKHLVRGVIKGEMSAYNKLKKEKRDIYTIIPKYISTDLGSVGLLDSIQEEEIKDLVSDKIIELSK